MTIKPRRFINCYLQCKRVGDGEGMVIVRVCTHENKINYRGGFAQALYQLTGEFNTIEKR